MSNERGGNEEAEEGMEKKTPNKKGDRKTGCTNLGHQENEGG